MDQRSRTTSHQKWYSNSVQHGKLRTNRGSWFIYNSLKFVHLNNHDSFSSQEIDLSDHHPAIESSESVDRQARGDPFTSETSEELLHESAKITKPNKNEDHEKVRRDPCHSDIPEWLQKFRENLVDERVPEHRDSHASVSCPLLFVFSILVCVLSILVCVFSILGCVGVYSTLSHSPRALHWSVPCSQQQQQQQQQRAGALTLSSSCLDGSVTPVGPGLNPQYTGAPKAGGGCGLLAKSTTTSPMAQPQCSNINSSNVNMVAEQFRSTAR